MKNMLLTVSEEDDGLCKLSPCTQMLSVTNAMCSASSIKGETRNRAHLFKSSMDWTEGKKHKKGIQCHSNHTCHSHQHLGPPLLCNSTWDLNKVIGCSPPTDHMNPEPLVEL